jgi:hypothetical protein
MRSLGEKYIGRVPVRVAFEIMPRRILVTNALVRTMDADRREAEAFLLEDGQIATVGSAPEVRRAARGARVLDLHGAPVVPGFIDGHAHMVAAGFAEARLNLQGKPTIAEMLEAIREHARTTPPGEWVVAVGFDDTMVRDRRYPTSSELDEAAPDVPVMVIRLDGHSCVLNARGFRALHVDPSWPGVDSSDARPTGVLRAEANAKAQAAYDALVPRGAREEAFGRACRTALSVGLTAVHGIESAGTDAEVVLKARDATPLGVRLYVIADSLADVPSEADGLKLFADGSMDSHTALLFEPYADRPDTAGVFYQGPERLRSLAQAAEARGLQVITHAIGDRAIEETLRAYEGLRPEARHRIEHFELPTREHIDACRERGIVVSTQPAFVHIWDYEGFYVARAGVTRARRIHPYRTLVDRGVLVCGGSDAPVTPLDPILGVHAAVNHPLEDQRLTPTEALRMFTIDAARAGHADVERGSITPGKAADFVVLSDDPLAVPSGRIKDIRPVEVYVRGERVASVEGRSPR